MYKKSFKDIVRDERGGVLLLAIIGSILLTLTGISMLRQSQTESYMSANHYHDKLALFTADAGINRGISMIRSSVDQMNETIDYSKSLTGGTGGANSNFFQTARSGFLDMTESAAVSIATILEEHPFGIPPPLPAGFDASSTGPQPIPVPLTISARLYNSDEDIANNRPPRARKEIMSPLVILMQTGH